MSAVTVTTTLVSSSSMESKECKEKKTKRVRKDKLKDQVILDKLDDKAEVSVANVDDKLDDKAEVSVANVDDKLDDKAEVSIANVNADVNVDADQDIKALEPKKRVRAPIDPIRKQRTDWARNVLHSNEKKRIRWDADADQLRQYMEEVRQASKYAELSKKYGNRGAFGVMKTILLDVVEFE